MVKKKSECGEPENYFFYEKYTQNPEIVKKFVSYFSTFVVAKTMTYGSTSREEESKKAAETCEIF